MASINSVVIRLDDKTALEFFHQLAALHQPQTFSVEAAGLDQIDLKTNSGPVKELLLHVQNSNTFLITQIGLHYQNFGIRYIRSQDSGRISPFYDEIQISHNSNQGGLDQNARIQLIAFLNDKVALGSNLHRRDDVAVRSIEDLQTVYESTILKLETAFAEQIKKITDWTVEQTSSLEKRKLALAEETTVERERLIKDYEARAETLRQESDALEVKRRDLDDRAYMHARRGIHSDLRKTIKERQTKFTLTPETTRLRLPVHVVMILLLLSLAVVNYVTLEAILHLDLEKATLPVLFWAFGKQTLVTLALVGALFFYIRWMNRWFEQHASAEFHLKQFELDIDRASWVVESAMEWRDQKTEIPAPLLEGITRNLFSDRNSSTDTHSAADDLASALVGNASQLKLKVGENELSFDKRGLARLSQTEAAHER